MEWEYQIVTFREPVPRELPRLNLDNALEQQVSKALSDEGRTGLELLTSLGRDGWELVTVMPHGIAFAAFLKRPLDYTPQQRDDDVAA